MIKILNQDLFLLLGVVKDAANVTLQPRAAIIIQEFVIPLVDSLIFFG